MAYVDGMAAMKKAKVDEVKYKENFERIFGKRGVKKEEGQEEIQPPAAQQ